MTCGKKAGKTTTLIQKCLEMALSPNPYGLEETFIACISISYDQTRLTFNPVIRKLRAMNIQFEVDHARTDPAEVTFTNLFGSHVRLKCYSTKEPENLLGAKWDLALIDEAAYMQEDIWTSYLNFNTRRAYIATSPHGKNWVYKFYLEGQKPDNPEFFSLNFDTFSNDKMPPDDLARLKVEAAWCEKHTPYTYQQDFLGMFLEGGDSYFRGYNANVDNTLVMSGSGIIYPPQRGYFYSTGVDLGRFRDKTVIIVLDQYRNQCFYRKLDKEDWDVQRKEISSIAKTYPGSLWIDATGTGQPMVEALEKQEDLSPNPFIFGPKSKYEILTELRLALQTEKGMRLAPIPDLLSALSDVIIHRSDGGSDIVGDARGHLPDDVTALALANWGLRDFPSGKAQAHHGEVYTGGYQPKLNSLGQPLYEEENGVVELKRPGVEEPYILYRQPSQVLRKVYER